MDNRQEVREFLTTRRARITPDQVGLPTTGSRRVPGLRRSEVASIAGLSVEYYARLERGQIAGASTGVLDALARALQLDETERAHLLDLARAADGIPTSGRPRRRTPSKAASRLSLQWTLEAITGRGRVRPGPAAEPDRDEHSGRAFYSPVIGDSGRTPNLARFQFLDPAARTSTPTGTCSPRCVSASCAPKRAATRTTADSRTSSASSPPAVRSSAACGRITTYAPTGPAPSGSNHPVVGELTLAYEELAITAEPGLVLLVYTAEPGSPSAERLKLLGSWAAQAETPTKNS